MPSPPISGYSVPTQNHTYRVGNKGNFFWSNWERLQTDNVPEFASLKVCGNCSKNPLWRYIQGQVESVHLVGRCALGISRMDALEGNRRLICSLAGVIFGLVEALLCQSSTQQTSTYINTRGVALHAHVEDRVASGSHALHGNDRIAVC